MMPLPGLPLRAGEVIAGKYRIERVLGEGGMGVVVAAEHVQLRQRVAIKFLLPSAVAGLDAVTRFMREAQAAARIRSEHVARVIDIATVDAVPYIVMEFLEGRDLSELLAARGPLPLEEAVAYVLQACEGVAEAHAVGIIHRDLKPSNLFLCDRGGGRTLVKVLDFGISKSLPQGTEGELALTKTTATLGSPLYMSPEQMSSAKHVDVRTDIWSLGVTLFELLCATTPFRAESLTELVAKVLNYPPFPIEEKRPDLPPEFVAALARSLEKDRSLRYANVAEFAAAIGPFGPRHSDAGVERIREVLRASSPGGVDSGVATTPRVGEMRLGAVESRVGRSTPAPPASDPRRDARPASARTPPLTTMDVGAGAGAAAPWGGGSTDGPTARSAPETKPPRKRSAWPLVGAGSAIVVVAVGIAGALVASRSRPSPPVAPSVATSSTAGSPSATQPTAAPSVVTSALPPPQLEPGPTASAAPSTAASSAGTATPVGHRRPSTSDAGTPRTPPGHNAVAPSAPPAQAPPTAPPAASSAPACHVVQYVDSEGEIRFKQVCP